MSVGTPMNYGRMIVIEGPDGAGKTTVTDGVQHELERRGMEVVRLREPGGTALGEMIRGVVKGEVELGEPIDDRAEALLFAAARAQIVAQVIRPALERGAWVLLDRYEGSTMIYQGLGRNLGMTRMQQMSRFASRDLQPDVTVVLTVSAQTAARRMRQRDGESADRIEATGAEFLATVRDGYSQLKHHDDSVVEVSAEGAPDEVLARVLAAIDSQT